MTQIVNLCLDAIVAHLQTKMVTEVSGDDKVDIVKKGLLQVTKIQKNLQVGVTGGDHEDPNYRDGIISDDDLPNIGWYAQAREIGGGQLWFRRMVARLECYYIIEKFNEDEAHTRAYEVLGRLMSHIEDAPVQGLVDGYGERAIRAYLHSNTFFESGGPPKSYIFRGKVLFQILTERP